MAIDLHLKAIHSALVAVSLSLVAIRSTLLAIDTSLVAIPPLPSRISALFIVKNRFICMKATFRYILGEVVGIYCKGRNIYVIRKTTHST